MPGVALGQLAEQPFGIGAVIEMLRQRRLVQRLGGSKQQRLDQPQALRVLAHAAVAAGLRR